MPPAQPAAARPRSALATAFALALAAAVSLGLSRFSYALLLPPMRADLGWSYTTAGAMNTVNAAGYLLGALLATVVTGVATRSLDAAGAAPQAGAARFERRRFACGLAAYFLFGLGYIGYMTFIVTLLREQQLGSGAITVFYALLGLAVVASSFIWAGLLQRQRGGGALRLLNGLLALATVLPVLSAHPVAVFASGLLFGGVFLSVVASTTALVRHNLAPPAWPAGIAAFTTVFAAGQIVGPTLVGWVSDGAAGLRGGLAVSAGVLLLGALIAWGQRPLADGGTAV